MQIKYQVLLRHINSEIVLYSILYTDKTQAEQDAKVCRIMFPLSITVIVERKENENT